MITADGRLAAESMGFVELRDKLWTAHSRGLLDKDEEGFLLGFSRATGPRSKNGPSLSQMSRARIIVRGTRNGRTPLPLFLIDEEDTA